MTQKTITQRTYKKDSELVIRNLCPFWVMLKSFAFSDGVKVDYVDMLQTMRPPCFNILSIGLASVSWNFVLCFFASVTFLDYLIVFFFHFTNKIKF